MSLLRLVEEQNACARLLPHVAEHPNFTSLGAEQQAQRLLSLKLRHVEAEEVIKAVEHASEHDDEFRLANTGRTEGQKTSSRSSRFRETQVAAASNGQHSCNKVILTANLAWELRFEGCEAFKFGR